MSETDIKKKRLRDEIKAARRSMDREYKKQLDDRIFSNLVKWGETGRADNVLIYKSTEIEVDTEKIIDYCYENQIRVALPRCFGNGKMKFYFHGRNDLLEKSAYGIYEPVENKVNEVTDFNNTVCVVPALAVDRTGFRLGYGGGYYDRFISEHEEITYVVICYSENVKEKLVHNNYDRRISCVITEKGLEVYK